jgi:hypothetical protein
MNVGASDSGIAIQPLANFQHPPSRKFSSSVLSQACFCGVCHGSHSDKGPGNKGAISEAEVGPPVRTDHLDAPSASLFP